MLDPEQTLRLELLKLLAALDTPVERLIDSAKPLAEWILGNSQPSPCSTGDTE